MASKVDDILKQIPTLKIDIADIFNFGDKCVDPLAIEIIAESLNYALETSVRRLESVAKINPHIREAATEDILPAVKTLRDLIQKAPRCDIQALGQAPVKPAPSSSRVKKTETKEKKKAEPKVLVENITKAVTEAKKPTEKEILAAMSEEHRKAMKSIKNDNLEVYEQMIADISSGATPLEAFKGATKKQKESEPIEPGKQFKIKFDDTEESFMVVPPEILKLKTQTPEEKGVIPLSENSKIAKALMGKKAGEKGAEIEYKGNKYPVEIIEVKEGKMVAKEK